MKTLNLILEGTLEKRDDRWAAICRKPGIIAYGATPDEALRGMDEAATALIHSFSDNAAEIGNYLAEKRMQYELISPTERPPGAFTRSLILELWRAGQWADRSRKPAIP